MVVAFANVVEVVHLATSNYHTIAITDTGEAYSWGFGKDGVCLISLIHIILHPPHSPPPILFKGKLGHESEDNLNVPRRVRGGGIDKAYCKSASVSERHSCIVTVEGDLYTFGYGGEG